MTAVAYPLFELTKALLTEYMTPPLLQKEGQRSPQLLHGSNAHVLLHLFPPLSKLAPPLCIPGGCGHSICNAKLNG